jgi:hypothetical protein
LKLLSVLEEGFTLMVSLPKNSPEMARAAVQAGAQCLKVHINCHHFASDTRFGSWREEQSAIQEIKSAIGEVPLGLVTGETTQPGPVDLEEIAEFGFDFWDLFCRYTPPEFLELPEMGRMVAIDNTWQPWLVQSLHGLGVHVIEASIIPRDGYRGELSLEDVCRYERLARSSPMPILIPTQRAVKPEQVRYLRRAGAAGITIGAVVTGLGPDSLKEATNAFRWAIDDLA